jgi:hypothetical protein
MTVGELIEELNKFDYDLPVTVDSDALDLFGFEIQRVGLTNVYEENDYVSLYGNPKECR